MTKLEARKGGRGGGGRGGGGSVSNACTQTPYAFNTVEAKVVIAFAIIFTLLLLILWAAILLTWRKQKSTALKWYTFAVGVTLTLIGNILTVMGRFFSECDVLDSTALNNMSISSWWIGYLGDVLFISALTLPLCRGRFHIFHVALGALVILAFAFLGMATAYFTDVSNRSNQTIYNWVYVNTGYQACALLIIVGAIIAIAVDIGRLRSQRHFGTPVHPSILPQAIPLCLTLLGSYLTQLIQNLQAVIPGFGNTATVAGNVAATVVSWFFQLLAVYFLWQFYSGPYVEVLRQPSYRYQGVESGKEFQAGWGSNGSVSAGAYEPYGGAAGPNWSGNGSGNVNGQYGVGHGQWQTPINPVDPAPAQQQATVVR